jgi:hypothetical protein
VEYESYTIELLERTQKEDAQSILSLPYQFARGLLDEENGEPMNWTLFAVRRERRHSCKKQASEYVLPKFKGLKLPLPFRHPRVPLSEKMPTTEVNTTPSVSKFHLNLLFLYVLSSGGCLSGKLCFW